MLYSALYAASRQHKDNPALILDDVSYSYGQLALLTASACRRFADWHDKNVGVTFSLGPELIATLAALDFVGATVFLFDPAIESAVLSKFKLGECIREAPALAAQPTEPLPDPDKARGGKLVITTSGTTGEPKGVVHSWSGLGRKLKISDGLSGRRWLLTYRFNLFAGIQVFLQAMVNAGCLVAVTDPSMQAYYEAMRRHHVDYISATPTFWKKMMLSVEREKLAQLEPIKITLGAEIVTESVFQQLRALLPRTKLSQTFATTETGVVFSVHDGHAGFPEVFLQSPPPGVRLKIVDNELFIQSDARMETYANGAPPTDWIATGDLVEVREGRVLFQGRKTDLINVGGSKVSPIEVETLIDAVPGVVHVRVFGRANPVTGSLVVAEVVAAAGEDVVALEKRINDACTQQLAPYKRPRIIKFVDAITSAPSGKIQRRVEVDK